MSDSPDWGNEQLQRELVAILDRARICGCGSGEQHRVMRDILQRGKNRADGDIALTFYDPLGEICGIAVEFIANVFNTWKLLSHNSSIGSALITSDGELLLKFLNDFGTEEKKWPEWIGYYE